MFANNDNFPLWEAIKEALEAGNRRTFSKKLRMAMQRFAESKDELRLLFYIGKDCDEAAYNEALHYFDSWRTTPPADKQARCEMFIYALEHSLPPQIMAQKPYIEPRFKETVGWP